MSSISNIKLRSDPNDANYTIKDSSAVKTIIYNGERKYPEDGELTLIDKTFDEQLGDNHGLSRVLYTDTDAGNKKRDPKYGETVSINVKHENVILVNEDPDNTICGYSMFVLDKTADGSDDYTKLIRITSPYPHYETENIDFNDILKATYYLTWAAFKSDWDDGTISKATITIKKDGSVYFSGDVYRYKDSPNPYAVFKDSSSVWHKTYISQTADDIDFIKETTVDENSATDSEKNDFARTIARS